MKHTLIAWNRNRILVDVVDLPAGDLLDGFEKHRRKMAKALNHKPDDSRWDVWPGEACIVATTRCKIGVVIKKPRSR